MKKGWFILLYIDIDLMILCFLFFLLIIMGSFGKRLLEDFEEKILFGF